jgi:hypothetical protein
MLTIVPITLRAANDFVERLHRHHGADTGHKFSVAVEGPDGVCGVAIVGRPGARALDNGRCAEVTRTCTDTSRNANSCLYGAAWRAAAAMGYRRLVTYTELGESGASLRAAGWRRTAILAPRPNWASSSKKLKHLRDPYGRGDVWRFRWEIGPDAAPAITVDNSATLCKDTAMPRKKKTPAAEMAAAVAEMSIEEQLEAAPLPEPGTSVAARLQGIGKLVASAQAAGIDVPLALQHQVPTLEEIIADYKAKAATANDSKKEAEFLRDHLLAHTDRLYEVGDPAASEILPVQGFELERKAGFHESVSKTLLVQLGVDPDVIDRATVVTPYWYWLVKEPKAGA